VGSIEVARLGHPAAEREREGQGPWAVRVAQRAPDGYASAMSASSAQSGVLLDATAAAALADVVDEKSRAGREAGRAHMALSLDERAERVAIAARLGQQLWEANPNQERILARREAENRAFAETCARIRRRQA
jgi:hypothetical protein